MNRLDAGSLLGAYEIVGPLGAGGMGEVYRARDPRLGREVALKVLPETTAGDPERLARFEREARAVAALNHPHIVTIHSIEEVGSVRFLTMELIEGRSLGAVLGAESVSLPRALGWAIALADALAAAHEKGIVHRDLKPANVMVTREDRVKVLDFGLAKLDERLSSGDSGSIMGTQALTVETPLSSVGSVVGTVPYMAPEQIRGEPVDARTDLFALGIVLYELVTGRRPFEGRSSADVSSAILRDAPVPPQNVRTDLPRDLARIIARCLEKDRERRFQTAKDVRNELEFVRHEIESGVMAPPRTPPSTASGRSIAVLPFSNLSADPDNEYFSDGLSEELLNVLAKNPELKVAGRTSSFAFKGKHEDLREIGQKLGVATLLEGSVRRAGNRVRITAQLVEATNGFHLWSETYDRVLDDIFAVQDDIARSVAAAMNVTLLGQPQEHRGSAGAYDLVLQANHFTNQMNSESLPKAVSLYREAIERSPDDARAWAGLGRNYALQAGQGFMDSMEGYREAREAVERALAIDDTLPEAYETLAFVLGAFEFRWAEFEDAIQKAFELAPGNGNIVATLATFHLIRGRIDEAHHLILRAIEIDPLSAGAHMNQGRIDICAGRFDEARAAIEKALELSPQIVTARAWLGVLHVLEGRPALGIHEASLESSKGYRSWAQAIVHHAAGDARASDQALEILLGEGDAWSMQLANVYAYRGDPDRAFQWLERAYFVRDAGLPLLNAIPLLRSLHGDPRWKKLVARIGLA